MHFGRNSIEMLQLGLILGFFAALASAGFSKTITPGEWVYFESGNYPKEPTRGAQDSWTFTSTEGTKIKAYCSDFRFIHNIDVNGNIIFEYQVKLQEPCALGKMEFYSGNEVVTKCGVQMDVIVESQTNELTVKLISAEGGGAIFQCAVKEIGEPLNKNEVKLNPGDGSKSFNYPVSEGNSDDQSWVISSTDGSGIKLTCDLSTDSGENGECNTSNVKLTNGGKTETMCGSKSFQAISTTGTMKLSAEMFPHSFLDMQCTLTNNDSANDVTIGDELEDSSEHGVVEGTKSNTCECGAANKQSSRIFNGTDTGEGEYPYMVQLRWSGGNSHKCGASLITPIHVLTAAHCVSSSQTKSRPEPSDTLVVIGGHHLVRPSSHRQTKYVGVDKIFIPDEWYTEPGLVGDIAIILLYSPLPINKWISPVCLSPEPLPIIDKYVKALGWGAINTDGKAPQFLQVAEVQVLDNGKCNRREREICFKTGPSTACYGDSGGPYLHLDPETNRYVQVGISSYVYKKCTGSYFIGTNTITWFKWIQDTVTASSTYDVCYKKA